jgi:uncharacterized protein YkwD
MCRLFVATVVCGCVSVWFFHSAVLHVLANESPRHRASTDLTTAVLVDAEVVRLANRSREARRLNPLVLDERLSRAAQEKAQAMADVEYFGHQMPDGSTAWDYLRSVDYNFTHAGENLAIYFTSERSMVRAWLRSPAHRAVLLDPAYTHTGVGIAAGYYRGYKTWYVVHLFGSEQSPTQRP